jgi:hypothetical protein
MIMQKKKLLWIVAFVLIGALAVFASSTALAQDTNPTDEVVPAEGSGLLGGMRGPRGMGGMRFGAGGLEAAANLLGMTSDELTTQLRAGETLADLADKAGLDLQTLRDAVEAAQLEDVKAQIQQSVTDGNLTQAAADWMLQGIQKGYNQFGGRGVMSMKGGFQADDTVLAAAAEALGMTTQDLSNQLWAGRTLADVADKAGVELQTVTDAMQAAQQDMARQHIEQMVAEGTITQEQADWMLEGLQNGYGRGFGPGFEGHRGGGRGPEGRGGFPMGAPGFAPGDNG